MAAVVAETEKRIPYHEIEAVPYDLRWYEGAELSLEQINWVAHVRESFDTEKSWMKFQDTFRLRGGVWERRATSRPRNPLFQEHQEERPRAAGGGPLIIRDVTPEKVRGEVNMGKVDDRHSWLKRMASSLCQRNDLSDEQRVLRLRKAMEIYDDAGELAGALEKADDMFVSLFRAMPGVGSRLEKARVELAELRGSGELAEPNWEEVLR